MSAAALQEQLSLDQAIRRNASEKPHEWAYLEPQGRISWSAYDARITFVAETLVKAGLQPGDRIGIWIHDGAAVHVCLAACNRAGMVAVGLGARTGGKEIEHVLGRSRARALITPRTTLKGEATAPIVARLLERLPDLQRHVELGEEGDPLQSEVTATAPSGADGFALRVPEPGELVLVNSTSGTTGLPKCVAHDELRWHKFHQYAADAAELIAGERLLSVVPAPYGFGLWSAHYTPSFLGSPCGVLPRFDVEQTLQMLVTQRIEVLMAVSTQFIMLLGHPQFAAADLSHLRVLFTGGEAIPPSKAAEFEEITGAKVLNFYGSNEAGAISVTSIRDTAAQRHTTAGRALEDARVRLVGPDGREIARADGPGQPANNGAVRSLGYLDDPEANRELYTDDGWMLLGDLAQIDEQGYLSVVGRTSDIIIRGGKNISASVVESAVATHPNVLRCAAVAVPDEVFGERVCICVVPRPGRTLTLTELTDHLRAVELSVESIPERLLMLEEMPMVAGGKVAKTVLRERVAALPAHLLGAAPSADGRLLPSRKT